MNIMILGAGGPIGGAVAKLFAVTGIHPLVNVSRRGGTMDGVNWVTGDRNDPAGILALIKAHAIDTVIDFAGWDPAPSIALINAIDGMLERYVFISSSDVYRNHGLIHRKETGSPNSGALDEDSPLRSELYLYRGETPRAEDDPVKWFDTYDKIPIEAAVQNMQTDWIICRLPMVYGSVKPSCRRFEWVERLMRSGKSQAEIPAAFLDWTLTYGHIQNTVSAIYVIIIHPDAGRQIFNITDHEPMTHLEWLAGFSRIHNWHCDILPTDSLDNTIGRTIAKLDVSVPLIVSGAKLKDMLGIAPIFDLDYCLQNGL